MSNKTESLTVSGVTSLLATSAIKGTVNIFKAIAYLFAGLAIIFTIFLVKHMKDDVPYNIILDPDCTVEEACWQEQETLIHKHKRRIGDLSVWGDFATEFEEKLPAALNGDVESQIFIALLYANGEGVHQDFDKALEWVCKAVANDSFEAGKLYNKISVASISDNYEPKQCNE